MGTGGAIPQGITLPEHARVLARTHTAVLEGRPAPLRPREVVSRSWRRVLDLGLSPEHRALRDPAPTEEILRRREASGLHGVVDELAQVMGGGEDVAQMLLVVTDADGVVLWREGTSSVRRRADRLGFVEGATWTEACVGTNAIGTALAEAAPVQLFSAEHFEQLQHPWYCSATPVHDPWTGRLLGVIDVSGPAFTLHPAIGVLVETARRLAEARLLRRHQERLEAVRRAAGPVLAGVTGPAVVVDDDGWVATSTGVTVGERLAVPAPDRPLRVPGLGLCLPEPLPLGWLIRPGRDGGASHPAAARVELRLLLGAEPVVEVVAGGSPWRHRLTARHADILVLVHAAGPAGISASELSRALYGDADHVVTVRAEVSRLRRALGAVLDSNPYRLATGTSLSLEARDGGATPFRAVR